MLMESSQASSESSFSSSARNNEVGLRPLVLVAEDDADSLLLITYILDEVLGCQVASCKTGQAAIAQAQATCPKIILLDIILPDINGLEVARQLRQNPMLKATPIVAVTALARPEDRERILQSGFTDYISKPYMLDDIEAIVRRYLETS